MKRSSVAQDIRDHVRENPGISTGELAAALSIPSKCISGAMRSDILHGHIDCDVVDGQRRYWHVSDPDTYAPRGAMQALIRARLRHVKEQTTAELAVYCERQAAQTHVTLQAMEARGIVVSSGTRPVRWSLAPKA